MLLNTRFNPACAALILLLLAGCAAPPRTDIDRPDSYALPPAQSGLLAELHTGVREHCDSGESATLMLKNNVAALRYRLGLIDSASESLDLQYYLWYWDDTGAFLAQRILRAADRGVRVRLLIDDFLLYGDGRYAAAAASHPNISVRVFNPWWRRSAGSLLLALEWLQRSELNHRMHNKLLVADNSAAIVGGRNLANEYFGLNASQNFADMDMLLLGPAVQDLSATFDDFWNDDWAHPAESLVMLEDPAAMLAEFRHHLEEEVRLQQIEERLLLPHDGDWSVDLNLHRSDLRYSRIEALSDRPDSVRSGGAGDVYTTLKDLADQVEKELVLISAYFVPLEESVVYLAQLVQRGVRVVVLTNSLASTNHTIVHSQYRKQRKNLLRAGVELYEMRHDPEVRDDIDMHPTEAKKAVLHTKVIIMDRDKLYVGALNLSPRSALINTENGVLIDDPDTSKRIAEYVEEQLHPDNAWHVQLDAQENVTWTSSDVMRRSQPALSGWQRFVDWFYGLFPLAGQI